MPGLARALFPTARGPQEALLQLGPEKKLPCGWLEGMLRWGRSLKKLMTRFTPETRSLYGDGSGHLDEIWYCVCMTPQSSTM